MGKVKSVKSKLKLAKSILEKYENQTCNGYIIKCVDGEFLVNGDCFKFSDFFNEHLEGTSQNCILILSTGPWPTDRGTVLLFSRPQDSRRNCLDFK